MSKYQLSELEGYVIDYDTAATVTSIKIQNIKLDTSHLTNVREVAKYTYAINGNILYTYDCKEGGSTQAPDKLISGLVKGHKSINVTALDVNGEVIGSIALIGLGEAEEKLEIMYINNEYRGQGVAQDLYNALYNFAIENGIRKRIC